MGEAAREAGVPVVTGDTKVVERGKADGVFIATAGIGLVPPGIDLSGDQARPGDAVLLSGQIGDHGVAIMSWRENLSFETAILSDSAALHGLVAAMVARAGAGLRLMRDPTRGGLAATLNEIAHQSGVGILLGEAAIPVRPQVAAACELLGLDPLERRQRGPADCHRRRGSGPSVAGGDARPPARGGCRRDRRGGGGCRTASCR